MKKRGLIKFLKVLLVIILIALIFNLIKGGINKLTTKDLLDTLPTNTQHENYLAKSQNKLIDDQKQTIDDLTTELIIYKQEQKDEELRRQRIEAMQQPDIIYESIQSNSQLQLSYITSKGTMKYADILKKNGILGDTTLDIQLTYSYEFRIEFQVDQIQVEGFVDDCVILRIPKLKPTLTNFRLEEKASNTTERDKWLAKDFSSEEMANIIFSANEYVKEYLLLHSEEINDDYENNVNNFKEDLKGLILKLGYNKVVIEEY